MKLLLFIQNLLLIALRELLLLLGIVHGNNNIVI